MLRTYKVQFKEFYICYREAYVDAESKTEAGRLVRTGDFVDDCDCYYEPDGRPNTVQRIEEVE